MSYSREIITKADAIIAERRANSELEQNERTNEASLKVPGFKELRKKLTHTMVEIMRSYGSGNAADAKALMEQAAKNNLAIQAEMAEALKKAGYPEDYTKRRYTCSVCSDTGYVNAVPCECRKALIKELSIEKFAQSSPADICTFDNFNTDLYPEEIDEHYGISPRNRMKQILKFCRDYANDFDTDSDSLYFYGATGLGKSHLALAIAKVVAENGCNVIYDTASALMRRIEKEHFASAKDSRYDGSLDELINCDLLVIDDLGSEFTTSFTVSKVYDIIDARLRRGAPIIISSNLSAKALQEKYTERIASRIFGTYRTLLFVGNDVRQIKK